MKKLLYAIIVLCLFVLSYQFALSEEGNPPLLVESKYFSVYGETLLDIEAILNKINFNYFLHPEGLLKKPGKDKKEILAVTLDTLYSEVSDILDIHIYNFHGAMNILSDQNEVNQAFKIFFAHDFSERSFYLPEQNSIYISLADLTLGVLGHEIAHAIISRYFVVPPPIKVQEVLCGYVEYKLKKL